MKLKTVQQNQINNEIVKLRTLINLTDDNIDDDLLIMIAKNLDKEWESFLKTLGITKQYIHFIMKLNKHLETNIDNFVRSPLMIIIRFIENDVFLFEFDLFVKLRSFG